MNDVISHYDLLIDEGNDPVRDPAPLRDHMDRWDGQAFMCKMELDGSKSVLEIGVGTGRLARKTAPLCKSFVGIDISPKTVDRAAENLSDCNNIHLICDDFISHEFKERFDVIYSSLTFMHIEDKRFAIQKVASLLLDGAVFVLSLDKNRDEYIDMGTRRLRVFPDAPEITKQNILDAGLSLECEFETDFAYVIVSKKSSLT